MGELLDPELLERFNAGHQDCTQHQEEALERRVAQAEVERAALLEHRRISDAGLLCFAQWCRMNEARFVLNPEILRGVFDAYRTTVPDVEAQEERP